MPPHHVEAGDAQTVRISPADTVNGLRELRVTRPDGTWVAAEYRRPTGSFDDFSISDPVVNGVSFRIDRGLYLQTYLLDGHPSTSGFLDAPVTVGGSVTDPLSGARIDVVALDPSGATLRVSSPDGPVRPRRDPQRLGPSSPAGPPPPGVTDVVGYDVAVDGATVRTTAPSWVGSAARGWHTVTVRAVDGSGDDLPAGEGPHPARRASGRPVPDPAPRPTDRRAVARSVVDRLAAAAFPADVVERVAAVLAQAVGPGAPIGRAPARSWRPVLGVDACRAGWVGVVLAPGAPRPRVVVAPGIAALVETVRESADVRVVGIDIPIGLPDTTTRAADALARRALPGKASSVFTTLTRAAYAAADRAEADVVNRSLSGQGVGAQAFALRAKILEVDAWVRSRPTVEVLEVHPEVSFAEMAGAPLVPGKKTAEGRAERLSALAAAGVGRPSVLEGSGYAPDDVLDACAVAWTAARRVAGLSRSLPDPPEVFSDGIPAAIHA